MAPSQEPIERGLEIQEAWKLGNLEVWRLGGLGAVLTTQDTIPGAYRLRFGNQEAWKLGNLEVWRLGGLGGS